MGSKLKINQSENKATYLGFYCDYLFFKFYSQVILLLVQWQQEREAKEAREVKAAKVGKVSGKNKKPAQSKSARAGLQFPVGRMTHF